MRLSGFSSPNVHLWRIDDPANVRQVENAAVTSAGQGYQVVMSVENSATAHYFAWEESALRSPLRVEADTPSHWRQQEQHVDYILIAHPDFWSAATRLADFWRGRGLSVALVSVQDVYDEYNDGNFSAEAIRDFLDDAYHHWLGPPPLYVTLLGDGHYDFRNVLHSGAGNFIPPLLRFVDPFIGETASDNRYVTVDGDDPLPDMLIGRLPANTSAEADAMVDKVIGYQTVPPAGDWRNRLFFVADNSDGAGDFPALSDRAMDSVPSSYRKVQMYVGRDEQNTLAARQAVHAGIAQGNLFVNYVGHGSISWWAAEILFSTDDVPRLDNRGKLPVFLEMTCYTGYFHSPGYDALAETLVRQENGGAVADWAASGLGVAHGHDYLNRGFYEALFRDDKRVLGVDALAGKLLLYQAPGARVFRDLLDTYILFGDPAMRINSQKIDLSVGMTGERRETTAGTVVTYTINYANAGPALAPRVALTLTASGALENVQWQSGVPVTHTRSAPDVWLLGDLPAGVQRQLLVWGHPTAPGARVEADIGSFWTDSDINNNHAAVTIQPPEASADVYVHWSSWPQSPLLPRQLYQLGLDYGNCGASTADNLRLTLSLPAPLRVVSAASRPQLWHQEDHSWRLNSLLPGAHGSMTLTVQSSDSGLALPYSASGRALIEADNDIQFNNNSSRWVAFRFLWPDSYEPDNTRKTANFLWLGQSSVRHTIHAADDVDWFRFFGWAGMTYKLAIVNLEDGGDTVLQLYDSRGHIIAKNDNMARDNAASRIVWTALSDDYYYAKVSGLGEQFGWHYDIVLMAQHSAYLPAILSSTRGAKPRQCRLDLAGVSSVGSTPQKLALGDGAIYVGLGAGEPALVKLNGASGQLLWKRSLGSPVTDLVFHAGTLFVSQRVGRRIVSYDDNGTHLATWPVNGTPWGIAWQNDALWLNNYQNRQLLRFDPVSDTWGENWQVGYKPTWMVPAGNKIYLPLLSGQVEAFNQDAQAITSLVALSPGVFSLAVDEDRGRLYVGNLNEKIVSVVDGKSGQLVATLSGVWPSDLQLSPHGRWLFVLDGATDRLLIYDSESNKVVMSVTTAAQGERFGDLLLDFPNDTLWVTNYAAGSISHYWLSGCGQ